MKAIGDNPSKRETSFVAVLVERAVIPASNSTKRTHANVYFPSLLFILASIGAGTLAYSPVIALGLYVSLHDDRTGAEASRAASQTKGEQ